MAFRLPRVPSRGGFSPRKLPALLRQKGVVGLYIFTLLISTSYYIGYSYIEPFMKQVAGMRDSLVTTTLMIYGGAGFLGSIAFSRYYNRNRKRFISVFVAIMSVCLLLLTPISGSWVTLIAVCALWGLAATAYNVAMQSNIILITTPESTSVAMSIFRAYSILALAAAPFWRHHMLSGVNSLHRLCGSFAWFDRLGILGMQTWQQGIEGGIAHTCIIRLACKRHRAGTEKHYTLFIVSLYCCQVKRKCASGLKHQSKFQTLSLNATTKRYY